MIMKFQRGDRVRISEGNHWAKAALGTVVEPPEFVRRQSEDDYPYDGWRRVVQGVNRAIEFYFVTFDEPQIDADGDGPYSGGEIEADMIEPL